MRLAGKVAVITGGAGSIGGEIARTFEAEGASVAVCDIRPAEFPVFHMLADVSSAADVGAFFDAVEGRFGGVDILVNNAVWVGGDTTIADLDEAEFDRVIAVSLRGPFLCTRRAIAAMRRRGGGSIVTLSSVNALFGFGHTAYTAAKGGLISMMRLVAAEYGHLNIRSNLICPGTIETDLAMRVWKANPESFERLKAMYPLGRIGTMRDVANCALFLASEESSFVTGSVYVVDGGVLSGRRFDFA